MIKTGEDGWNYKVMDLSSNESIDLCIYADDFRGEYDILELDSNNCIRTHPITGEIIAKRKYGNIKLVRIDK